MLRPSPPYSISLFKSVPLSAFSRISSRFPVGLFPSAASHSFSSSLTFNSIHRQWIDTPLFARQFSTSPSPAPTSTPSPASDSTVSSSSSPASTPVNHEAREKAERSLSIYRSFYRIGLMFVVSSGGFLLYWLFNWPEPLGEVVEMAKLDPLVNAQIGTPESIKASFLWMGNYVPEQSAAVSIPISGSKGSGTLYARAVFDGHTGKWKFIYLHLSIGDKPQRFTLGVPTDQLFAPNPTGLPLLNVSLPSNFDPSTLSPEEKYRFRSFLKEEIGKRGQTMPSDGEIETMAEEIMKNVEREKQKRSAAGSESAVTDAAKPSQQSSATDSKA